MNNARLLMTLAIETSWQVSPISSQPQLSDLSAVMTPQWPFWNTVMVIMDWIDVVQ